MTKHIWKLAAAVLFLSLSACGTTTAPELRSDPGDNGTFRVALPYRAVYINIARKGDQCFHGGTVASAFFSEPHEVIVGRYATVEIVQDGIPGSRVLIVLDIRAAGEETEVTYYVHRHISGFRSHREGMVRWATDPNADCGDIS